MLDIPIRHSVVLWMSMKPAVCSPHHSECAICCRNEINCLACPVEVVSMQTVKARYEEDNMRRTAATSCLAFSVEQRALHLSILPKCTGQIESSEHSLGANRR